MEPLKCRWEPGAVVGDKVRPAAKLLVWDGGRRWRILQDYDWLPVTLDDLNAKEARAAALRTSIHNRAHLPIEQGHAFEAEMRDDGLSLRAMAKKYSVDKSYIENRVNLLKCPADVQQFAADNPGLMSHALAMRPVADKGLRATLMEYALHGAPVRELVEVIAEKAAAKELKQESQRAPDSETQSRAAANTRNGGGSMSRGLQVTITDKRAATREADAAASAALANLDTLEQWLEQGGTVPKGKLLAIQRQAGALLGKED